MSNSRLRYVKYAVIIALAVIVGIFLGRFITSYETQYLLSRKFCGTYRGIDVYKCGKINDEYFIAHAYMLEAAPDVLVECCTDMYFTGGDLSVPIIGNSKGRALGLTQDSTIYITTDSFDADVIFHELFHAYDNAHGKLSESYEFLQIFEKEKDRVVVEVLDESAYSEEFFAAAGASYLLEPLVLKAAAPETYEYIDNLIRHYD